MIDYYIVLSNGGTLRRGSYVKYISIYKYIEI